MVVWCFFGWWCFGSILRFGWFFQKHTATGFVCGFVIPGFVFRAGFLSVVATLPAGGNEAWRDFFYPLFAPFDLEAGLSWRDVKR